MTNDFIDYGQLIDEAMHYVVRKTLLIVKENGLPGDHHFFITFDTNAPGVMISDELRQKYPEEMTIVIQHQYWDLEIQDEQFSIVLSFDNVKHSMTIPFSALLAFVDPSVKFGLQFNNDSMEEEKVGRKKDMVPSSAPKNASNKSSDGNEEDESSDKKDSDNVVTLDSFRKK